jgi:glucose/arabinose dehydrogenase
MTRPIVALSGLAVAALVATACTAQLSGGDAVNIGTAPASVPPPSQVATPGLRIEEVAGGLEHGWDIGFLPDGKALVTQRPGKLALLSSTRPGATVSTVDADFADVFAKGEGGLMGMVVHPDFATSRQFTTCQTYQRGGQPVDIRLVTWRLSDDGKRASKVSTPITGMPIATNGRHSGCRPTVAPDGTLLVATGDTAKGNIPQDRTNLGGKVLRVNLTNGAGVADNPFANSTNANEQRVYTYGHRNVQGLAIRPGNNQVFTAEHGPTENDEVNLLRPGANYGWDPSQGGTVGGYDEDVPMTDLKRFPDAVEAKWLSGETTEAVCALTFLSGPQWGTLDGMLVMTALKGAKLLLLRLDEAGAVTSVSIPGEFNDTFGRLRAARTGPDGALYVTTSNGDDDKLLRVSPN